MYTARIFVRLSQKWKSRRVGGQRKDEKAPHVMVDQESMTQQDRNLGLGQGRCIGRAREGKTKWWYGGLREIPRMKTQNPKKGEVIALELTAGQRQRRIALVFAYWKAGKSQEDREWFAELEATVGKIQLTHEVLLMGHERKMQGMGRP